MTGDRRAVPHGVIHKIPYFRLQGGRNAIILDPQIGDIGMCGFCSRDSSAVIANKDFGNPGSFRKFDWADGLYFGGFLNGTPSQYIRFSESGIDLVSPTKITLDAPEVEVTGKLTVTGVIKSLTDVLAKAISLLGHKHGSVQSGDKMTGDPQ
ncbi:MAG: phage baseplate protein [Moraxellaceae bacterium]|nr:MAG: phage baseplate protein [Moraxellaceae bacterium]